MLNSCSVGDSGSIDFGRGGSSITYVNYKINFHRINAYPSSCKILISEYFSSDSVAFLRLASDINVTMPASDSNYNGSAFANSFYYLKWKVTGPNNDSLAGGRTSALKMKAQATFEINY